MSTSPPPTDSAPARRPRGRPRDPEIAERRRRELIEAAYEVFATKGYREAGIADIVGDLGLAQGTFYRYFTSKREILDHVIDYGVERVTNVVRGDALPGRAHNLDELIAQLDAITHRLLDLLEAEPGLVRVVLMEATAIDEELTHRILGLADTHGALAAAYLAHGVSEGFLREDLDVDAVGAAIGALVLPAVLATIRGTTTAADREALVAGLLDFVRAGVEIR